jgi:heptaprenyl diphosphate synthase
VAKLAQILAEIKAEHPLLEAVEERLREQVAGSHLAARLARSLLDGGGKRLRPILTIVAASFYPLPEKAVVDAAVAGELIHLASLVHDDIIDNAHMRRGQPTINDLWGNQVSVLTGDHLFATAFSLLADLPKPTVLRSMTQAIRLMCEGEIEEILRAYRPDQTEADYFRCIEKKTAQLLAACCQSGALLVDAPFDQLEALGNYGLRLGCAFQIIDDILDLTAQADELGKPVRWDFQQGIFTLPILYARRHSPHGDELTRLVLTGQHGRAGRLLDRMLREEDAILYAWQEAARQVRMAEKALRVLPPHPARNYLRSLAAGLLEQGPLEHHLLAFSNYP